MSKRPRTSSSSSSSSDSDEPAARLEPAVVARLYVSESTHGEAPEYIVYTSPYPARSLRVHAAIRTLQERSSESAITYVNLFLGILGEHASLADMDARLATAPKRGPMDKIGFYGESKQTLPVLISALRTVGDAGREDDRFTALDEEDVYEEPSMPLLSVLRFQCNY